MKRTLKKSAILMEVKECLFLAVPLAGAQLAQAATAFTDTVMMGLLGSRILAAGGLGATTFSALLIIGTGVVSAVSPLAAEAHGTGRIEVAGRVARQGLWLSVAIALPATLLIWNGSLLLRLFGQEEENVMLAETYLRAIAWGYLPGLATFLVGQLGTVTLAAHQIALQSSHITFMVPLGISFATTVRVGQLSGRGDKSGARLAGYVGIGLGSLFMGVMAILFWTMPRAIISLYLDVQNPVNGSVVMLAGSLLSVAALFQMVDGIQIIAAGALRGLKDTRIPMLVGILAYWCIGLTSGYLLGLRLGFGGVGLWLGLAIGLSVAATILTWRFHYLISPSVRSQN